MGKILVIFPRRYSIYRFPRSLNSILKVLFTFNPTEYHHIGAADLSFFQDSFAGSGNFIEIQKFVFRETRKRTNGIVSWNNDNVSTAALTVALRGRIEFSELENW